MREIIEKHFENMVDEILLTSETYEQAISSLKKISVLGIHQPGGLIKSLEIAIKRRACQQKHPTTRIRCQEIKRSVEREQRSQD
ncbi:TPA: hypothetical protein UD640_000862 [Streptococcus suis]|nr:hypothetical protein [Streptococcus suis]